MSRPVAATTAAVVFLALAAVVPATSSAAPPNVIRTAGPSTPVAAKVALVATRRSTVGRAFRVLNSRGRVVRRGHLRRVAGSPLPWRHVAAADFSTVRRPGRYRVVVGKLRSRVWRVDRGARTSLVRRLLRVFAVNSDGREPNPVFGPAHLNDATVINGPYAGQRFDLTGGWRDAGDTLKFTYTVALGVAELELAARLDPGDAAALRRTSDVGVRWLRKAHPRPDLFVMQVGREAVDHATDFRDPARDDASSNPAIARREAFAGTGANVAGMTAAALALAARRTGGTGGATLLQQAREWYAAGRATGASSALGEPYEPMPWEDKMALGAAELFRVTGEVPFLADAVSFMGRSAMESGVSSFDVGPLSAADLAGGLGAPAVTDPAARAAARAALGTAAAASRDRAALTAFGTPGPFSFGFVQDNAGSALVALAAQRAGVARGGARLAAGGLAYLLGRNPWGISFIVGRGRNEVHNPHHPAYLKGSPSRLLSGAVVGGPATRANIKDGGASFLGQRRFRPFDSSLAVFEDRRDDYVTSEVGIGYSAPNILLAAALP